MTIQPQLPSLIRPQKVMSDLSPLEEDIDEGVLGDIDVTHNNTRLTNGMM